MASAGLRGARELWDGEGMHNRMSEFLAADFTDGAEARRWRWGRAAMSAVAVWVGATMGAAQVPAAKTGENVMNVMKPTVTGVTHFVAVAALDFRALLPEPPAAGSLAAESDLLAVRQAQAGRTPEQVAWAKLVEKDVMFNNATVLGAWLTKENLPKTAEFFAQVGEDLRAMDGASKKPFLRARPTTLDASLQPCVAVPASTSYPSGSAMQAWVWAELLAEIFPAKRGALMERAERAAWGRVIGGVHFPSDLVGGKRLAGVFLAEARKNVAFRAGIEAARAEMVARAGK